MCDCLDMQCEEMLRCPNGTTSSGGAKSVFDCVLSATSTTDDVLVRVNPFNEDHPLLRRLGSNSSRLLAEHDGGGRALEAEDPFVPRMRKQYPARALQHLMPFFTLRGWDVATITVDLRALSLNITYFDHWRFGIYENCQPCPTRYACNYLQESTTCAVSLQDQESYGVYCSECCACRRMTMPAFFEVYSTKSNNVRSNNVEVFPYLDNKHKVLQITITALLDVDFVFSLELVHGLYVPDFSDNFLRSADIRYLPCFLHFCIRTETCGVLRCMEFVFVLMLSTPACLSPPRCALQHLHTESSVGYATGHMRDRGLQLVRLRVPGSQRHEVSGTSQFHVCDRL